MCKTEIGNAAFQRTQHRLVGYGTKSKNGSSRREFFNLCAEIFIAGTDFSGQRLVFRRQAFHSVGDPAVFQHQPIVGGCSDGLTGKTMTKKRFVEEYPGMVSGKRASGTVGAVHSRRKTDDQQPGTLISKRSNGPGMIVRMRGPYPGEMSRKSLAAGAVR